MKQYFTNKILHWHKQIDRELPWKSSRDPYIIWLSEIILQQTRVSQGLPYFHRFTKRFPDVKSLAEAKEDEILKLWQGLGYYTRARNLHASAKYIHHELRGQFPDSFRAIKQLKGVGDYTAAAIASFAFGQRTAVVDGNVYRVLSRFFGIKVPIDTTIGKKEFSTLANELIPSKSPGNYNQAIMDFGAMQCTPGQPDCKICPLKRKCFAKKEGLIKKLPVKSKKQSVKHRYFHYVVINERNHVYLVKRNGKDIWKGLYEFPLIESNKLLGKDDIKHTNDWGKLLNDYEVKKVKQTNVLQQQLTHQKIHAIFFEVKVERKTKSSNNQWVKTKRVFLDNFAFPRIIDLYLAN